MHKKEAIFSQASLIWEEILGIEKGIRLLGITVTNLDPLAYEKYRIAFVGNRIKYMEAHNDDKQSMESVTRGIHGTRKSSTKSSNAGVHAEPI